MTKKLYKLVRKEDGIGIYGCNQKDHYAGDIWESLHTEEGSVFTLTKLKNRWNSQWLYWHQYWGIPLVNDNSFLGYHRQKFNEQTIYKLVEVR